MAKWRTVWKEGQVEPSDEWPSYGENHAVPGCKCSPTNVLVWELSPAWTADCPIHHDVPNWAAAQVNRRLLAEAHLSEHIPDWVAEWRERQRQTKAHGDEAGN